MVQFLSDDDSDVLITLEAVHFAKECSDYYQLGLTRGGQQQ